MATDMLNNVCIWKNLVFQGDLYMEINIKVLAKCPLFEGLSDLEIEKITSCFAVKYRHYEKGEIILIAGYPCTNPGIVLSGEIMATKEYADGKNDVISVIERGGLFGEILAFAGDVKSPVTLTATLPSETLFIDYKKIITPCENICAHHTRLISNLLRIIGTKYWDLHNKIKYIAAPSLREKLMEYLMDCWKSSEQSLKKDVGKKHFSIPFDRDGLAAYINCDRSALSRELSRMKNDGLIDYKKNEFTIYY